MLSREDNELICRVGPNTAMGNAMRRFWIPAMLSSELPQSGRDPLHVELLGESFVGFRNEKGEIGLLDEMCCHRGASLTVGRVEHCGIRCIYHGWLFSPMGGRCSRHRTSAIRVSRTESRPEPIRFARPAAWSGPISATGRIAAVSGFRVQRCAGLYVHERVTCVQLQLCTDDRRAARQLASERAPFFQMANAQGQALDCAGDQPYAI